MWPEVPLDSNLLGGERITSHAASRIRLWSQTSRATIVLGLAHESTGRSRVGKVAEARATARSVVRAPARPSVARCEQPGQSPLLGFLLVALRSVGRSSCRSFPVVYVLDVSQPPSCALPRSKILISPLACPTRLSCHPFATCDMGPAPGHNSSFQSSGTLSINTVH